MNCKDFQHWLSTKDAFTDKENPEPLDHLKVCESCKILYNIDLGLEKNIKSAFHQQKIPRGMLDRIELTLDDAKGPVMVTKLMLTGIMATLCLFFIGAYMVFFDKPFQYQSLQQLSENAVVSHLKGNMTMSFNENEIEQALAMLSKELKFNVIIPDLKDKGYILLGGRLCVLGKCKTAYLFYKKQEKICSLFIMDYDHLGFEMADGSRFNNIIKGCHTDIWKEKGQVYAMVY